MQKELISFIEERELNPFERRENSTRINASNIFKTPEGKAVFQKVMKKIGENFNFSDTSMILNYFSFTQDKQEIARRQEYFKSLREKEGEFLLELKTPKAWWKPDYSLIVVTETEQTFLNLRESGCPAKLLVSERDV